jgi:hypothetical protein
MIIKTIIVGIILLIIAFFSIKKLLKVLRGEESGCSCGGCDKKNSCGNYDENK